MNNEVIERYKKYLTNAQVKELAAKAERYKLLNAQNRATAQTNIALQRRQAQRGLQNVGLAGREGKLISGQEVARNDALTSSYDAYNRQLRNVEAAQTERQAVRMVNANIAAQRKAAEEQQKLTDIERQQAEQDYFVEEAKYNARLRKQAQEQANKQLLPEDYFVEEAKYNARLRQKARAEAQKQYDRDLNQAEQDYFVDEAKYNARLKARNPEAYNAYKQAESIIEQNAAKWDAAINNGNVAKSTDKLTQRNTTYEQGSNERTKAIDEMERALSQKSRAALALEYPQYSQYLMMTDDQFAVSFAAAEQLYNKRMLDAAILRKDSSESMDDLTTEASNIEAQAHKEFAPWENAKSIREHTSESPSLGSTIEISDADKTKEVVPEGRNKGKLIKDATEFVYWNQQNWNAVPWANESEWNGQNWKTAKEKGWSASDYKGKSKYDALINEWAYINGRTALLYTQKFNTVQSLGNFKDLFTDDVTRNNAYHWFRDECMKAFGNYADSELKQKLGNSASKEQMDAMLTLANLMTDEERARFNGMLETYGPKYADEYFEYLYNDVLPQRFVQYTQGQMAFDTRTWDRRVGQSLMSVPTNILQSGQGVKHTMATRQNDPVAAQLGAQQYNMAQSMREAVGQHYGKWGNFAYQTAMSMADSATVALISGGIGNMVKGLGVGAELAGKIGSMLGGSILGASAFNSSYQEALQKGLSPDKARWTAVGNGVNEMLFEAISLDMLVDRFKTGDIVKVSEKAWKNWIVNTLIQAGVEGSEEVFTDLANNLWDKKVNGIYSEELTKLREYIAQGMSYEEAKKKVNAEFAGDLGMSFLGGALSGGVMGGAAGAMHNIQNRYFEKRGAKMDASVKTEIDNFKFTNKQAQELQQQSKKTNMDYGMLEAMMYQQMFAEGKAYIQKALNDGTITQEQKDLYDKYAKLAAENKLTNEMLKDEQVAQDMEKLEPVFDIMEEGEMIKNGMRDLAEAQRAVRDENAKYDKQVAAIENDTTLTDEQKQQKLDAIENERGEMVVEKVRDLEKVQKKYDENVKAANGKVETKRGSITYDFSTSNKANTFDEMSDRQKSALRFAKLFADKYGMNIKVVDDTVAGESEDGHYNHDTDTITINISGANSVMYTVSHEVTHWLQEHNGKAYKSLKAAIEKELSRTDLLVSELPESYQRVMGDYKTADNTVMEALVKYEQDMYKRQMNKALSKERAEDEVVARCCESFLKDRGFAQKMVAENPGTARTIAAKLRQLANDMKTLNEDALERGYEKYGDLIDSSIEKAALEQIGDIEKIARMWENALNQAAKKAAKTKAPKAEVQHSFNNKLSDVDSPVVNRIADATFPIQPPTIKGADAMQKSVSSATKNALLDVQDSMFHPTQYSRNYAPQIQQRNAEYVMSKVNDDGTVKTDKQGNPLLRYPAWAYTRTGEKIVELAKRITKLYENQTDSHGNRLLPEETILSNNIFENASYLLDAEPTTECFRQTIYRAFLKQVTDKLGRPVTEREAIIVNQACIEIGIDAPCIYCYSLLDRKAKEAYKLQYLAERDAFFKALDKEYGDDIERFRKDRAEGEQTTEVDKKTQEEHTVWTKPYMLYLSRITDPAAYKDGKYQKSMARDGNWSKADRVNLWLDVWENSYKNGTLVSAKDVRNIEADKESLKAAEGNELRTRELQDVIGWSQDASQAKVIVPYSAYTNEGSGNILSWSQDKIDKLNSEYGLRWYSHADFHPAFIVDNMQQILDASAKGLKGLMYLKPTEAAEIYAPTGMLINLSCFAQYKNGQYVVDDRLGADWATVQRLRKQYKNVGAVMVVTSDDMWMWAMTQDWVDVIIPLHLVRSGRDFVDAFGLQNYSKEQADALVGADAKKKYEAYIEAKAKEQDIKLNSKNRKELEKANKSVYPSEHENDYTKYMEACKKRGLTPRFDRMRQIVEKGASYNGKKITLDDYMKCVNETRMPYTKAQPLQPKFNFAAAERAAAQLKQKGFFDYFKPSSEWNGKTMKVGDWVNQAYNDILAKKEPSKLGYGRDLAIDKNGKYIEVKSSEEARQRGVGGAHDNVQHSFNDKEYLALAQKYDDGKASRGDEYALDRLVRETAKENGYTTPKLYHGTPTFGFSRYEDRNHGRPFIYTSSKREVAAHYAGDRHYAGVRDIGRKYEGGMSARSIINDARTVWGVRYSVPTKEDINNRIKKDYATAKEIFDRFGELGALSDNIPVGVMNALETIRDIFYTVVDNDLAFGKGVEGMLNAPAEEAALVKESVDSLLDRYEDNRTKVRDYFGEHRSEMSKEDKAIFLDIMSYEVGDAIIDIKYGLNAVLKPDNLLYNAAQGSFRDKTDIRNALDETHNIGAYQLYGDLGSNPFIFDADGAQFWALKVPEVSDGYTDTDAVSKWAMEHGYTSVVMKNIYDYGDKADNYVFFNPNQIKSADLVTYDNDGNIIPLSERFKTDRTGEEAWKNEDIRYSMNDKDYVAGRLGNQEYLKYLQLGTKVVNQTATEDEMRDFKQRMNELSQDNREAFLDKLREKLIRADEAAKVREVRDRQIARLKAEFKESKEKARERRVRSDLTNTLKKGNDCIVQLLARPTENAHVPVQLAQAVSEYAMRLNDLLTKSEPKTGEFAGMEKQTQKGALNAQKILDALKRSYADAETIEILKAEDPKFDPRGLIPVQFDENGKMIKDDSLAEMVRGMDEIIQGKHLNELTTDELRYVMNTMRGVIHAVTEANKVTVDGESRNVYRTSRKMANEVKSASKVFGDKSNAITKFLNRYVIESLGLRRIAKLYSGSNENATFVKLVDDLNEGAIEQERIKQTLRNMFSDVTSKYEKDMKTWYGKNAEWIDTGFGFKITKGMRVSLAMHILNEQNLRNVEKAGLRIPEQSAYRKGNYKEAYKNGKVYRLTKAQAEQIVSHMTEAEKAYFEVAKEFFHKQSGKYINRTSLKLLGFSKAIVDNYFPIQTDDAYRTVKYDDVHQNASVEHPGFLESRKGTANVMYLNDINAVVNRQIEGVAKYAGLAIPMRAWNNVMNAWLFEENENGEWVRSDEGRPHDVLERRMGYTNGKGKAIMDYVDQFITDLSSGGVSNANDDVQAGEFAAKLTSNYVKAVLTLNARVALSQLASVPTAAAEIPWKYIVQGFGGNVEGHLNRNASNELIDMYTPIFAMRRAGTQTEVSEVMKRKGFADKAEQKLPGLLGWITAMDTAATRRLWYACERWVKGETDIPVGSDAFYQEVARRYERVIQNTQPNFTVLQRSPALRSKNAAARIITMFGTQRMQNAGVFIESAAEVIQAKDKATRKAALKKFGRALSGQITAAIVLGVSRAIVAALRGRMKPLQDEDKEITFKSVDKYIRGEVATSLAGSFMYVGEIYDFVNSIISGFTKGDTGYETSFALPAAEALSTMIQFFKDAVPFMLNIDAVDENGKPKYTDHEKWTKTKSFINGLMTAASYATGLPLQNASKTILNGWLPLGQDIADAIKTGEFIPYLNQSGKLDSSNTAANYKEWTNDGKKGSVYLYWEKKWKEISNDKKQPNASTLSEMLMRDSSLSADDKAQLYRMLYGEDTVNEGSVVYTKSGNVAVDFTDANSYLASTELSDAKYEGYKQMVADGIPEDIAYVSYRQYAAQQKQGAGAKDRFHDWLFKMVSDPHERAVIDMHVIGNTNSVKGDIGYKDGKLYRDYSTQAWYDLSAINGQKQYTYAKELTKTGMSDSAAIALVKQMKDVKKDDSESYLKGLTDAQKKIIYEFKGWKWK